MTANRLRRGSALLIVLGMMSFMLFSGLAFAVYMRYSRLPTSFLRRTTTTRQLAKAALAEAIEEIDTAIGNDPHPGVSKRSYVSGVAANTWRHRVFFGSDLTGVTEKSITPSPYAPSVLTLEGLAYLPPNLVNDVRYYSRCTPTADWQPFWFDSGRYAYVAVDVSDYFDVNRLLANARRAASSSQRITLAHLFEKVSEGSDGVEHKAGSGADAWDQFIDETCGDSEPFVSLADFNIAWGTGSKTFGGQSVANPFRQFVNKGYAYGENVTAADPKAEYYRQLTFVTDSWSPTPKRSDGITVADLEDPTYQPFKRSDLESTSSVSLDKVAENNSSKLLSSTDYLGERLCALTRFALWDYLDEDKRPLSLAVPTCERVPMICGIQPEFSGSFKVEKQFEKANDRVIGMTTEGKTTYEIVERDVTYAMSFEGVGSDLSGFVGWTYPFLLKGSKVDEKFKADGRVAVFLTDSASDLSARPGNEIKGLYWDSSEKDGAKGSVTEVAAIYPFAMSEDSSSLTSSGDGDTVAVKDMQFKAENCNASEKKPMVTVTFRWKRNQKTGQPENPNYEASEITNVTQPEDASGSFGLLKSDGTRDSDFSFLKTAGGSKKAKVNVAVWARVTDEDKKTVDLVPACLMDDGNLNGVDNTGMNMMLGDGHDPYPLLKIAAEGEIEFSLAKFESGDLGSYAVTGQALLTGDPRFNYAPENWQVVSGVSDGLSKTWYKREKAEAEKDGCEGDIYMATSDQGYLQSIYELMMLPRIQTAGIKKAGIGDGFKGSYGMTFDGKIRSGNEALKDRDFMWRTYLPKDFDEIGDGRIVSGDSGPKVNPYSDSTNVLMAAFANTPHDWRVASTNNDDVAADMAADEFNKTYAWNDYSTTKGGKLCWDCLSKVAGAFSQDARESGDWETAFRELGWNFSDPKYILSGGEELDKTDGDSGKLYSVDKKYLYGFWHDSFSARQQLFLVFVRAEPMMMGGGVAGQAPPQLGARAVALVWREPSAFADAEKTPRSDNAKTTVHRTRVLFYHQFD